MGVPGLFRDLIKVVPVGTLAEQQWAHFLLDYNNVMYTSLRSKPMDARAAKDPNDACMRQIVQYTTEWVRKVAPSKSLYVSIDGPVPYAKLVCQRRRRFKRQLEESYRRKQADRFGEQDRMRFDTTKFTPGTAFMDRFVKMLKPYMQLVSPETRNYVSDHHVPGEGEHKLMRYLNTLPPHEPACIYGLDADLIVLSLLSAHPNLYLVRDTEDGVETLSIEACRSVLHRDIIGPVRGSAPKHRVDAEALITDLCCLWALGGNDFVPGLFAYAIRVHGTDPLVDAYVDVVAPHVRDAQRYLVDRATRTIDWDLMHAVLQRLATWEPDYVRKTMKKITRDRPTRGPPRSVDEAMERFQHMSYWNPRHPFHRAAMEDVCDMQTGSSWDEWCARYQRRYDLDPDRACEAFLSALAWTWQYYATHVPPTWDFAYPFEAAPLASWFAHRPTHRPECPGTRTRPYSPLTQLAYVIPPQTYGLLPRGLRMEKKPVRMDLDYLAGKYIYAEPRMDMGDIDAIETHVASADLDDRDRRRDRTFPRALQLR